MPTSPSRLPRSHAAGKRRENENPQAAATPRSLPVLQTPHWRFAALVRSPRAARRADRTVTARRLRSGERSAARRKRRRASRPRNDTPAAGAVAAGGEDRLILAPRVRWGAPDTTINGADT